jgi:hypothetical protein
MKARKKRRTHPKNHLLAGIFRHFVLKVPADWGVWDGARASPIRYDVFRAP